MNKNQHKINVLTISLIIFFIIITIIVVYLLFSKYFTKYCEMEIINSNKNSIQNIDFIDDNKIGTLNIEKIGLNAPIKDGVDLSTLNEYVGHLPDSPFFEGNVCLYAHNSGYDNNYFENLYKLEIGDKIQYSNKYFTNTYKVLRKTEIDEDDMTVLNTSEENILTLITCITGKSDKRLCIVAKEEM